MKKNTIFVLNLANVTKLQKIVEKTIASSGNRTRAARVAGEHSTTEPTMLEYQEMKFTIKSYD